jgi:hypothetical protein
MNAEGQRSFFHHGTPEIAEIRLKVVKNVLPELFQ